MPLSLGLVLAGLPFAGLVGPLVWMAHRDRGD
jgi:hypothetical protein